MVTNNNDNEPRIGPTGDFPEGKLNEDDEGGLQMRVGSDPKNNKVILDFGSPVHWIGLDPEGAQDLARLLSEAANKLLN
jgi:hypothetical protein